MKIHSIFWMVIIACAFSVYAPLNAQQEAEFDDSENGVLSTIGVMGGYLSPSFSGALKPMSTVVDELECPCAAEDDPAEVSAFFAGLSITPGFLPELAIQIFVENVSDARYITPGAEYPVQVINEFGQELIALVKTEHETIVDFTALTLRIQYEYELPWFPLRIAAGISPAIVMSSNAKRTYNLVEPVEAAFDPYQEWIEQGITYSDDSRTITIQDDEIEGAESLRFALSGAIAYAISVDRFEILPFAAWSLGLSDVSSNGDWRFNAVQIGLETRLRL